MITLAIAGATFLPWVFVLVGQLNEQLSPPELSAGQYATKAAIRSAYTVYAFMFGATLELGRFIAVGIGCVAALCALAAFCASARRHGVDKSEVTAVMIFAAGGLFGVSGAMVVMMVMLPGHPDLSMPERVSFILPHFALLAGWLVSQTRNGGRRIALVLYAIPCAVSLWHLLKWDENNAWDYVVPWREIASDVEQQPGKRAVIFDSDSFGAEGWYYFSASADDFIDHRNEREAELLGEVVDRVRNVENVVFVRSVRDGTPLEMLNMTQSNLQKAFGKPVFEKRYVSDSENLKSLKNFVRRGTREETYEHKVELLIFRPAAAQHD